MIPGRSDPLSSDRSIPPISSQIDVDHFKSSHGHHTGDRVLIAIADLLRERVRGTDVVGRWGGQEFVVLLRLCRLRDAVEIAEKLRANITDPAFGV